MRIIAGKARGLTLAGPSDQRIRPTSDRTREAIFNILEHGIPGFALEGARVLDLFAGTGALGLEALSRGARFCIFVDEGAVARGLIRRNVEAMAVQGSAKIWRRDATRLGPCAPMAPFELVFADPPYGKGLGEQAVASALAGGWLAPRSLIVLEEAAHAAIRLPAGLHEIDRRVYGDTQVLFLSHGFR
ncbi:16S rRNA (guanine(966)-N(2))-methyltransferase RsmD [Rhodoligotrophos defluvii]|uniref:16S rRNA (guanine(966)-N(2))-methyltransferase RsmD n=1 Tax=Rhodoligotrophos defluvii TaxID=2561934 RepID=UPI0010C9BA98|nr:16S rRNA (guanine(966)-N(2))-methyltransferase RsmD [Rhodoligotrophos defluvii]